MCIRDSDYNAPNFYSNFVKGRPIYSLGLNNYEDFYNSYVKQSRQIIEQKINLSEYQKKLLVNKLITNSREANRSYQYNYFEDNCSTKIADIFNEILEKEIENEDYDLNATTLNSYRKLVYKHISPNSWGALGIDICLGAVIDRNISLKDELFLPYNLKSYFDNLGSLNIKDGNLVETNVIYGQYSDYTENSFSPVYVILILSLILTLDNLSFESSIKLSILTLTNTTSSSLYGINNLNFIDLNNFTKMSLIIFMILAKIEIIAVIYLVKKIIFKE